MKYREIILEISASERAALRKQRAEERRAAQRVKTSLDAEAAKKKAANQSYTTGAPTVKDLDVHRQLRSINAPTGQHRRDEIRSERDNAGDLADFISQDPNEPVDGVYLRFETTPHSTSLRPYWTKSLDVSYDLAKEMHRSNVIDGTSASFIALIEKLMEIYTYLHVIFTTKNISDNPEAFRILNNYLKAFSDDEFLTWEIDKTSAPVVPRASSMVDIPEPKPMVVKSRASSDVQGYFVKFFKSHPELSTLLTRIPQLYQLRARQDIESVLDDNGGDIDDSYDEIREIITSYL